MHSFLFLTIFSVFQAVKKHTKGDWKSLEDALGTDGHMQIGCESLNLHKGNRTKLKILLTDILNYMIVYYTTDFSNVYFAPHFWQCGSIL